MHEDLKAGVRDSLAILLGILPFALVFGIAADGAGLTMGQTVAMSAAVFAGTAQLAAVELLGDAAPLAVVIGTAVVINLRMLMYSASIAPHLATYHKRTRAYLAYFLTDHVYAVSIGEYVNEDRDRDKRLYYLGLGLSIWLIWIVGTVAGAVFSAGVPPAWQLDFVIPLVFLAILVPAMKTRPQVAAALVSAGVAIGVFTAGIPAGLDLMVGAVVGIVAGVATEEVLSR
ncbi:AzlC family ABC transporter permease [Natronobeatus ordinarius]|uniref:AzlC family ABC transporter permease n=1 Tax=Natronobeatus ordinarius TaxID=2963433 RepID=UPI0020CBE6FD|nr:AzlC family ABC transporter permease [Natronobeatus ordinarius]